MVVNHYAKGIGACLLAVIKPAVGTCEASLRSQDVFDHTFDFFNKTNDFLGVYKHISSQLIDYSINGVGEN
jgi:hypothetical protein